MKLIPLSQGKFAQVDDEDFDFLSQWKWHAHKKGNTFYAVRTGGILMHRIISNALEHELVDHPDHNGLNNQKYNLRKCNFSGNSKNRVSAKESVSKYLGVSWHKKSNKWRATICINKKCHHLGTFINESDAAKAYNSSAKINHKEFANLNII